MVRIITSEEFLDKVIPISGKIFADENPLSPHPFAPSVKCKRVLFNWNYKYIVDPPLLDAVMAAAEHVGDSGFYIFSVDTLYPKDYVVYVPFSESNLYVERHEPLKSITAFEQILLSPQGEWGIITSHETHMLLGASIQFFEKFKRLLPDIETQIYPFLEHWQNAKSFFYSGLSTTWLFGLMEQIYDIDIAIEMLDSFDLL